MTRRERLMATLRGEPVDRPAVNFYEIGGFEVNPDDPNPFNVYNGPTWRPLLQLAEEATDLTRMISPTLRPTKDNCCDKFFTTQESSQDGSKFVRTTLRVAGRTMTQVTRRDPDLDTVWWLEHFVKDVDDLKAYLQLPDEVFAVEPDVSNLVACDRGVGDRGIVMVDTEDPMCAAAQLFSMEDYTIVAFSEPDLFHRLLEKLARAIHDRTEKVARCFPGHLWRIYGPEYATEPYLPPHLFEEYVVRYTGPMVQSIQKFGGFARVHCHGRIRAALPHFVNMGAVATDPIEPPPQGDISLAEVRRQYGKHLVLFGNLEIRDIENMDPPSFEKLVLQTLREGTAGAGRGFVLMPSAAPYGREISPTTMANYETMVRLATRFTP